MEPGMHEPVIGKIFTSGHSQALRIPRSVRFSKEVHEVEIIRQGDELVLRPRRKKMTQKEWREHWQRFFTSLPEMDDDFMKDRPLNKPYKPRDIF